MNTRPSQNTSVWDLRMGGVRLLLVAGCVFLVSARAGAAEVLAYSVILTGACQFQMIMGWDNCQNKATFTMFKSGKYVFEFIDKNKNGYQFTGMKDRQIDNTSLYSNIDTIETTIDGKKVVDPQSMGGCTTKITPSGEKFVYIDCAVTNSKRSVFKFRFSDITDVQRTIMQ